MGECRDADRVIRVDVRHHRSDRALRSTLLHEMCHAVAGSGTRHNSPFFAQLEHLLSRRAPIGLGFPENPEGRAVASIPARFVCCRRLYKTTFDREQRRLDRLLRRHRSPALTVEDIIDEFYEAANEGMTWRDTVAELGRRYRFLDIDGRPLPIVANLLPKLRRAHHRGHEHARVEQANRKLFALSPERWASAKSLSVDEAARRLGVPRSVLRSFIRIFRNEQETPCEWLGAIPPGATRQADQLGSTEARPRTVTNKANEHQRPLSHNAPDERPTPKLRVYELQDPFSASIEPPISLDSDLGFGEG